MKCSCSKDNHEKENKSLLKSANLKNTEKRSSLINCLRHTNKPLSAEDIYLELKRDIDINLSTVYRILSVLCDSKIILKQTKTDGSSLYQINDSGHKHIITCKECGKTNFIEFCPLEGLLDDISKETGYHIDNHNLEFVGICPQCLKKNSGDK